MASSPDDKIRIVVFSPLAIALAAVAFLSVLATCLFAFDTKTLDCTRSNATDGVCILRTKPIVGGADEERWRDTEIAQASYGVRHHTARWTEPKPHGPHTGADLEGHLGQGRDRRGVER